MMSNLGLIILGSFLALFLILGLKRSFMIFFCYCFLDYGLKFVGGFCYKDLILLVYLAITVYTYKKHYVLATAAVLMTSSMFLSEFLASERHWPATIFMLIRYFGTSYILLCILGKREDLSFLLKCLLITCVVICTYAIYELIIGSSPIVDLIRLLNRDSFASLDNDERYGVKRLQSFFMHATAFSYFCVIIFTFMALFVRKSIWEYTKVPPIIYIPIMLFLCVCVMLTGTRSSILPLLIFLAYFIYKKSTISITSLILMSGLGLFVIGIGYQFMYEYFGEIINSIINTNEFAGSSTDMRSGQFELVFQHWRNSPFFGHGMAYASKLYFNDIRAYGLESIWMPLLLNYGMVGCISYIISLYSGFKLIKGDKVNAIIFMSIIVFINTATSVPGLDLGFILSICVIARACIAFGKQRTFNLDGVYEKSISDYRNSSLSC